MTTYEAKIISVEIKNEDSINKIFLTCEAEFGHNVQAILYNPAGDYSIPLPDDFVTLVKVPGTGNYIAIGNLNTIDNIDKGEKYLYSRDANGDEITSIYLNKTGDIALNANSDKVKIQLKNDGKLIVDTDGEIDINGGGNIKIDATTDIELNGNTKKFVTYTELNTALQVFVGLITAHVHTGNLGNPTSTPTSPITLDISAAETITLKTGG